MTREDFELIDGIVIILLVWWLQYHHTVSQISYDLSREVKKRSWRMRAKSSKDCPHCQKAHTKQSACPEIMPWSEVKSKRGRPKTISSEGNFCPNKGCCYYGIMDENIHALVGYGKRGVKERIQWWKCQCCQEVFSERHDSGMRWLKTPSWRVQEIVTALGEGVDQAAAVRIFGHHPTTIARWLRRAGQLDMPLHDHYFNNLTSNYIQLDELKTKTRKMGEIWLWVALDVESKVMLALNLAPRQQKSAYALLHEVKQRLDDEQIPIFSSDGLRMYFYAITAHYGLWLPPLPGKRAWRWVVDERVLFAQLHKVKSGFRLKDLRSYIRLGTREVYRLSLQQLGFSGKTETAYVERINLTLRQLIAPLSRRTWSLAYDEVALRLHIGWGRVYYHYARPHASLSVQDTLGRHRLRTPAMAAKVVPKKFSVAELMLMPVPGLSDLP